jgi:hypothetical protein
MAVSANYPVPVIVNGFTCKNCTDVDNAKKHIDPAHPKAGPYGIDAKDDPSLAWKASVKFGGSLSALNNADAIDASDSPTAQSALGNQIDLSV